MTSYKDAPTHTLSAGGADFAYRELGPKAGVPVIFLGTWPGTSTTGNRGWSTASPQSTGSSPSTTAASVPPRQDADTIEAMAKDAVTFIRALGFDQVDLHGFSMGGMIAQVIARDEPELVRKLILTGTGRPAESA